MERKKLEQDFAFFIKTDQLKKKKRYHVSRLSAVSKNQGAL
jgi:hypothetical protein